MKTVNKVKIFLSYTMKTKLLLLEAFILLGWARILKMIPFSRVAPTLGEHMSESSFTHIQSNIKMTRNISQAVHTMSRNTFWESECLVRAIAAMKMLERRKIESTLYLGTAKDKDGKLIAHAWLRSGPIYVTGSEGMENFIEVGKFAKINLL